MSQPRIRAQSGNGKFTVGVPVEVEELPKAWRNAIKTILGDSVLFEIDATDRQRIRVTGRCIRTQNDEQKAGPTRKRRTA